MRVFLFPFRIILPLLLRSFFLKTMFLLAATNYLSCLLGQNYNYTSKSKIEKKLKLWRNLMLCNKVGL
jgi:hypothetical protein